MEWTTSICTFSSLWLPVLGFEFEVLSKFSSQAIQVVFLGYLPRYKGYKLLNLSINTVFISRDVIFHESIFPFKHDQLSVSHLDFFFDRVLPDLFSDDIPIPESLPSHPSNLVSHETSSNESLTICPTTSDRPTRVRKPPSYLCDYHWNFVSSTHSSTHHPLFQVLCYNRLFSSYRAFVHSIFLNIEPTCYTEAAMVLKWQHAMSLELQALESNGIRSLTTLPTCKQPVGCK